MLTVSIEELNTLESTFELPSTQFGSVDRFVGWFECDFDGYTIASGSQSGKNSHRIKGGTLDTGPAAPPTHWQQMVFHLTRPVNVRNPGEIIAGKIRLQMSGKYHREMSVRISVTTPDRASKSFTVVIVPDTSRWVSA